MIKSFSLLQIVVNLLCDGDLTAVKTAIKLLLFMISVIKFPNNFIMSDWKTSRDPHQARKLYTESNMKTNTSFEFSQTIPSSELHGFHFNVHSIVESPKEQLANSVIYIKDDEVNNNSSFSLKPVVTAQQINQLLTVVDMIRFYACSNVQRTHFIHNKIVNINSLASLVVDKQYTIKTQKLFFQRRREELENKKIRMADFRKKRSRTITEESQRMQYEIKSMLRDHRIYGVNQSNQSQSRSFHVVQEQPRSRLNNRGERKKIYVPIVTAQHSYTALPQHHQYNPNLHIIPPSNNSPQILNSYKISQDSTKPKEPVLLSQLREALAMKLQFNDKNQQEENPNIDYFDKSIDSRSRNSKERQGERKIIQNSKQLIRNSDSSAKWKKADDQDKQLVQIIQNSIKNIRTQRSHDQKEVRQPKNQQIKAYSKSQLQLISPIRQDPNVIERGNRNSDSSQINITVESQDKRNSKSFESKDSIDKKKSSKKSDKAKIDQSNIKIDMIDMSISKNSVSSKSDSSKHAANRYLPSLNQPFQDIEEQSEELASLKTTPIENKLKNSVERQLKSQNSKNKKKEKETESNQASTPSPSPQQKQFEEDDILKSIRLETESRISRKIFLEKMATKQEQYDGDDILDGITLLRESKASREKGLSMKSSINRLNELDEDNNRELGSQSEIFSKIDNGEITMEQLNSSMRQATKSKIVKGRSSYSESSDLMKRGYTEPVKGHLTSIPSVEFEEEQDESSPTIKK